MLSKSFFENSGFKNFTSAGTAGIVLILLVAAYGKWVYPTEALGFLDRYVSLFEVGLVGVLLAQRKRWWVWSVASVIFSGWAGYAGFWYTQGLSCSCLGQMMALPSMLSLCLDGGFILFGWMQSYALSWNKKYTLWTIALCPLGVLIGTGSANWIYTHLLFKGG